MYARTLNAIKGSIKKWEKIVAGTGKDLGSANCPLCKLFIDTGCIDCPVRNYTGRACCYGSPYNKWLKHMPCSLPCAKCKRLANAELKFLKLVLKRFIATNK